MHTMEMEYSTKLKTILIIHSDIHEDGSFYTGDGFESETGLGDARGTEIYSTTRSTDLDFLSALQKSKILLNL